MGGLDKYGGARASSAEKALEELKRRKLDPRYLEDEELLSLRNVGQGTVQVIREAIEEDAPEIREFDNLFLDELRPWNDPDEPRPDNELAARVGNFYRRLRTWGFSEDTASQMARDFLLNILEYR